MQFTQLISTITTAVLTIELLLAAPNALARPVADPQPLPQLEGATGILEPILGGVLGGVTGGLLGGETGGILGSGGILAKEAPSTGEDDNDKAGGI